MSGLVIVINPNSTRAVTARIEDAAAPFRFAGGPAIECVTLDEGPPAIESQLDIERVVLPLCRHVETRPDARAFVIGCYSDPGLLAVRAAARRAVFGIAECAMLTALAHGDRFGVISISRASTARHMRYVRTLGLGSRCAADLPLDLRLLDLADDPSTVDRLVEVGTVLRDGHDADVVILGCAGMACFRGRVEAALGIPVIDPVAAAVAMAVAAAVVPAGIVEATPVPARLPISRH